MKIFSPLGVFSNYSEIIFHSDHHINEINEKFMYVTYI